MSGLIFFGVVALWLAICSSLTLWVVRLLPMTRFRSPIAAVIFAAIFLLPVADELAARPQFNELCEKGAVLKIDAERIKGKTVRVKLELVDQLVTGTALPIQRSRLVFRDTSTEEELGSYETYTIRGGFIAHWTRWPESGSPWTYEKSGCGPAIDWNSLPDRYSFMLIK